ncbi:MAG: hypothetical protein WD934_00755 [Gemmatimonadales bacterium]
MIAACTDVLSPGATVTTADLLPLGLQTAPPAGMSFWVVNNRATTRALRHNDGFNTLYAEIQVPSGSLASLNGTPIGPGDSIEVNVTPIAGGYGVTVGPSGISFSSAPRVTFSYARYGDATVADGSGYASQSAYAAALEVWEEVTVGRWRTAAGSSSAGTDQITALLDASGRLMVAAPR